MKNFNLEDFLVDMKRNLSKINFDSQNFNINNDVCNLITTFKTVLNKHVSLRTMTRKEKRLSEKPRTTKGILVSIKMKNKLFRSCFKNNNTDKKAVYKKYLNKRAHIKYHAKRNYYENLIKSNIRNPSQIWSVIKKIIDGKKSSKKSKLPSVSLIENQVIDTDSDMFLDKLCEYFANIGINLANNVPQTNNNSFKIFTRSCVHSFALQKICEEDVISCIDHVKCDSAPGSDEIPLKFVKLSKCILAPLLTKLFNKCFNQEIFSDPFKLAYVIPVPKISNPNSLDDLRPISLLPVFAKIFEKILERNMIQFLNKNEIISSSQFGFRIYSSTELAITALYDKLLNNLNENKVTLLLFLDLRKAFDSVNHQLLLKKLYHYAAMAEAFLKWEGPKPMTRFSLVTIRAGSGVARNCKRGQGIISTFFPASFFQQN